MVGKAPFGIVVRYLVPLVSCALATAFMLPLDVSYGRSYSALLMVAVAISVWYGGLGPGLFASALGTLTINFFFQQPRFQLEVLGPADAWQLVVFGVSALTVTFFSRQRRKSEILAEVATHRSLHDDLTQLPNRALLQDRLTQALRAARRNRQSVELMLIDLDGFKEVNDSLGHQAGDLVLQQVAQRLQGLLRESDTVGRLGGDEFVVILGPASPLPDVEQVAAKISAALRAPIEVEGQTVALDASIGMAQFPRDAVSADELLRAADVSMYREKRGRQESAGPA